MGHITDDEVREYAKSKNPAAAADVDKIDFCLWKEEHLQQTVREDVRKLREEKSLDGLEIYGFVLDTQTGVVTEVIEDGNDYAATRQVNVLAYNSITPRRTSAL